MDRACRYHTSTQISLPGGLSQKIPNFNSKVHRSSIISHQENRLAYTLRYSYYSTAYICHLQSSRCIKDCILEQDTTHTYLHTDITQDEMYIKPTYMQAYVAHDKSIISTKELGKCRSKIANATYVIVPFPSAAGKRANPAEAYYRC